MRVAPLRTWPMLLLGLALLVSVPAAAGSTSSSECTSVHTSVIPLLHPTADLVHVEVCDEDGDGASETVTFETERAPTEGQARLSDETKQRSDHQDRETDAEVRLSTGLPGTPIVHQRATVHDEGNDGQIDRIDHRSTGYTRLSGVSYQVTVLDQAGDRIPDGYGLTVCTPLLGCQSPDPTQLPGAPDRIDLPDTVVHLEPIGYIP